MRGVTLQTAVTVPFTKYRPSATTVSFWVEIPDVTVSLTLPRWNTRSLYSRPHRSSDIGRIGFFRLDASHCYYAEVHPENIDQLSLEFTVSTDANRSIVLRMTNDIFGRPATWSTKLADGQFDTS